MVRHRSPHRDSLLLRPRDDKIGNSGSHLRPSPELQQDKQIRPFQIAIPHRRSVVQGRLRTKLDDGRSCWPDGTVHPKHRENLEFADHQIIRMYPDHPWNHNRLLTRYLHILLHAHRRIWMPGYHYALRRRLSNYLDHLLVLLQLPPKRDETLDQVARLCPRLDLRRFYDFLLHWRHYHAVARRVPELCL